MADYEFAQTETKWQKIWDERHAYACDVRSDKPKMFLLVEFPYPSGEGLHVGHPRSYTALDIVARKRRMEGFEVMYGMGWDAFGLPAENYAIKTGIHPRQTTEKNINKFRSQLKALGFSFDWSREVNTTDPHYYKWTQWMFLQLFRQGLAYKKPMTLNYCPSCKTTLANEEVVDGACERCGTKAERRLKDQWMLKITQYADRLATDLDGTTYIPPVIEQQRNWIGRSEGAEISFAIPGSNEHIDVYSTRPDTLFGATYLVIAPEHRLIEALETRIANNAEVAAYALAASRKSDLERTELAKTKTGVELKGVTAINPATGHEVPVWVSDYVLGTYGTGAIMAVPGHDARDWDFAKAFNLPIVEVVSGGNVHEAAHTDSETGKMVNSGFLDGLDPKAAKTRMTQWLTEKKAGSAKVNYKLRDWVFSRQRYWGEPIPLVQCDAACQGADTWIPVPESQLPITLPPLDNFQPTDDGVSPLARATDWVKTTCPHCHGPALRETDTMPQWAGSCWYFMRYLDPHNQQEFCAPDILKKWMPVDWYNGGMEHTTLHLLYSRFWYKALADAGVVPGVEPYYRRTSHGMILGHDGEKMSKSRGNVINPDAVVEQWGADVFRIYEMFMGEFDKTAPWNDQSLVGVARFLKKIWALAERATPDASPTPAMEKALHQCIHDVTERIERMKFNTAVSALMEFANSLAGDTALPADTVLTIARLLSPFAPHMAEEIWQKLGGYEGQGGGFVCQQDWPKADPALLAHDRMVIAIQINGKLRATIEVDAAASEDDVAAAAMAETSVAERLEGVTVKKRIYVPGKILSFAVA